MLPEPIKTLPIQIAEMRAKNIPDPEIRRALIIKGIPVSAVDEAMVIKQRTQKRGLGAMGVLILVFVVLVLVGGGIYEFSIMQLNNEAKNNYFTTYTGSSSPSLFNPSTYGQAASNATQVATNVTSNISSHIAQGLSGGGYTTPLPTPPSGTTTTPPPSGGTTPTPTQTVCPYGDVGVYPDCYPIQGNGGGGGGGNDTCAEGETGTYPDCVPEACPDGDTGTYPDCVPPQQQTCPDGDTGTYPNCIPPQTCPVGETGTYPNCVSISTSTPPANLVLTIPTNGVFLGIHAGPESNSIGEAGITSMEGAIGRNLAIDSDYVDWNPNSQPYGFPNTARIQWDTQHGLLSMESWNTDFTGSHPDGGCATAADIIAGKYDAQLIQQADEAKALGVPILVRWRYEMTDNDDDPCFNNGQPVQNNFQVAGPNFVNSWKHIVDIFRQQGATNVQWVWSPSAGLFSGKNGPDTTDWKLFYPGNDYVDWIAEDRYNKSNTPESYATDPAIADFYSQVSGLGKPLMQAETGAHYDANQDSDPQTEWITTIYDAFTTEYPDFKALVYWNGSDGTYGLTGAGLAEYVKMANDPHFTPLPFSQ